MFLLSNIKNSIKYFFIVRTKSTGCTGSAGLGAKNDQPVPSSAGSAGLRHLCKISDYLGQKVGKMITFSIVVPGVSFFQRTYLSVPL